MVHPTDLPIPGTYPECRLLLPVCPLQRHNNEPGALPVDDVGALFARHLRIAETICKRMVLFIGTRNRYLLAPNLPSGC